MGYFNKSSFTNCHKMVNFLNFENGGTDIQKNMMHVLVNILSILLLPGVDDIFGYFRTKKRRHIISGFEENGESVRVRLKLLPSIFVANGRKDCVFNDAAVFVCYTAKVVFLTGGRGGNGDGAIKLTAEVSITING